APAAQHLGAAHEMAVVLFGGDVLLLDRRGKAGPSAAGVEFFVAAEERRAAARAAIFALLVIVPVPPGESALGALPARHGELLRSEFLLPLPIRLDDLLHGSLLGSIIP